jgi:hypothetical protein
MAQNLHFGGNSGRLGEKELQQSGQGHCRGRVRRDGVKVLLQLRIVLGRCSRFN